MPDFDDIRIFVRNRIESLSEGVQNLGKLSPVYLVSFVAIGLFLLGSVGIGALAARSYVQQRELTSDVDNARQKLEEIRRSQETNLDELRSQVQSAQERVSNLQNRFPTEAQAQAELARIQGFANEAGVDLQTLEQASSTTEGDLTSTRYNLRAAGDEGGLRTFLGRVQNETLTTLQAEDVRFSRSDGTSVLTANLTLTTSSASTGESVVRGGPTGGTATPVPSSDEQIAQVSQQLEQAQANQNWSRVIETARRLQQLDPGRTGLNDTLYNAYVNYGNELANQGQLVQAGKQFNQALTIRPGGQEAEEGLARVAQAQTPTPAVSPSPTLTSEAAIDAAVEDGRWEEAVALIDQLEEEEPGRLGLQDKRYMALVGWGNQLIAQGRFQEAKLRFSEAVDIKPKGPEALDGLARVAAFAGGSGTPVAVATATPVSTPVSTPVPGTPTTYVVQRGDTLFSIAQRFSTTVNAIRRANGLRSTAIFAGQTLVIPTGVSPPPAGGRTYVVHTGDTLFSLAQRFGTTVNAIKQANGLVSDRINIGQRLIIP